ncbi:MAG: hypothetical protein J7L15_04910, partial [Clostridiales bacterium]|nr:hypothetical protein [Clostridiales bacterium]
MIENICALEKIKKLKDNSQDIIFADPPYALGSTVKIGKDGKPYYKEAKDFMNKWDMPDEKFWEEFFIESQRVLKYGGRVLFFGIDRQLMLFQYYATSSGLETKQSLYWYFISNFPKATDLSKQIDKRLGVEREVTHIDKSNQRPNSEINHQEGQVGNLALKGAGSGVTTKSNTNLGQKYEGYKYSISPLKQTLETIMVFQKANDNSILANVLAYEDGDMSISPSIWNIDAGRVKTTESLDGGGYNDNTKKMKNEVYGDYDTLNNTDFKQPEGRFPSQLFIDEECSEVLDSQSGTLTTGARKINNTDKNGWGFENNYLTSSNGNSGGCSKILHKIKYLEDELDLLMYSPKVSSKERDAGLGEEFQNVIISGEDSSYGKMGINTPEMRAKRGVTTELPKVKNGHPTLKPIKLIYKIAQLLKSPNPQSVFFPFAGAGSE